MRKICRNIAFVCALVCAVIAGVKWFEEQNAGSEYEKIREIARKETEAQEVQSEVETEPLTEAVSETENERMTETVPETESETETETESETEAESETEKEPIEIPIDFAALQEMNPDIYAWIQVEGTAIDYPVVQHPEDNAYYLDHSAEGGYAFAGAIYTEDYNEKDFEDPNTVIYGHNMKNGSMFQSLFQFTDRDFFNENREIVIYLPDEIRHYEVFAAYLYDNRHILQSFDFSNEKIFQRYLNSIFSIRDMNAHIDTSMDLDKDSRIITLSTCYTGMDTKRYLVQAALVSVEK